jgi:hypothetical protein
VRTADISDAEARLIYSITNALYEAFSADIVVARLNLKLNRSATSTAVVSLCLTLLRLFSVRGCLCRGAFASVAVRSILVVVVVVTESQDLIADPAKISDVSASA